MLLTFNTLTVWRMMSFPSTFVRSLYLLRKGCAAVPRRCFGQPASQTHPHLVQDGEVTPGLTKEEYSQRRHNLMELIARQQTRSSPSERTSSHLVIIPAAAKTYMTHDIPYPFRQNTDFLYLSGFLEPDSILVLESESTSSLPDHKATLFVPKKDPHREMWDGLRSGINGALELTGVDFAFNVEDFPSFLDYYIRDHKMFITWYDYKKPGNTEYHHKHMLDFMKENRFGSVETPRPLIQALRLVKSPSEIKLMQKTCDIASKAFIEVIKTSHARVNEAHLYAKMDYECRVNGAEMLAYPPVVAGGGRANTIHYISNNQLIQDGEMVLMDAGCECHGYSSDITRTWPVSGGFSEPQRELYEAVLEVQKKCIELCGAEDMTMEMIFLKMLMAIGNQLQKLKFIDSDLQGTALQRKAREFCPHHVSHYLGMDVHDTDEVSRNVKLMPGMCITIEPGIYIPASQKTVPPAYREIGIRIEDDVLITNSAPVNLTASCPKNPDDLENILKHR